MPSNFYRFNLGDFDCACILDGYHQYSVQSLYANCDLEEAQAALRAQGLPDDQVTTPYTFLVATTPHGRVLFDMGAGSLGPETGQMIHSLQAAGIEPDSIDTVVISHAHPDHIGGTLNAAGQPNYPNARYFIQKRDWDFWFSEPDPRIPPIFFDLPRQQLGPLQDRITQVEGACDILPGIRLEPAYGHTPGQSIACLESRGQQLWYIADTVLQPLHLEHPDWLPVFDLLPEEAAASKNRIFDQAAREQVLVLGQHFPPFPSLGHIEKQAVGWRFHPIASG